MPGYGASPLPAGGLSFALLADAVAGLIETLGETRAHLVGLSMGGQIALHTRCGIPVACVRSRCSTRARRSGSTAPIPRPGSACGSIRWTPARRRRASPSRCCARSWRPAPTRRRRGSRRVDVADLGRGPARRHRMPADARRARAPRRDRRAHARARRRARRGDAALLRRGARGRHPGRASADHPGAGHISNLEAPEAVNIALREHLDAVEAAA